MNAFMVYATGTWKDEMTRTADRHHFIACWTAIILNPLFVINDIITIQEYWKPFLLVRILVTIIALVCVFLRRKNRISTEMMIFFPFIAISLQNIVMYSVMDIPTFQKHTFAYMALFIGAGMLILWEIWYSVVIVVLSLIANIVVFAFISSLPSADVLSNGGILMICVMIFTILLIQNRYSLTKKEIIARKDLEASNRELGEKNKVIAEKNQAITDSIEYARNIQRSILLPDDEFKKMLPESFVFYRPQSIVSGDFYWGYGGDGIISVACCDCTGHGVPGACMSMLCSTLLNEAVIEKRISNPASVLDYVRKMIITSLKQTETSQKDGMDAVLIMLNTQNLVLQFAATNNPLIMVRDGKLIEHPRDKQPVGFFSGEMKPFTLREVQLQKGDVLYMFSDGFKDQNGGPKNKKLGSTSLKEMLFSIHQYPMKGQKDKTEKIFTEWLGTNEQVDDVLVIGIRV